MDRKERTLRALQGLPVDRPPMGFWHHFVGADMEKENFVDSHVRFYRETGEDFIKMMCDGFVALPDLTTLGSLVLANESIKNNKSTAPTDFKFFIINDCRQAD